MTAYVYKHFDVSNSLLYVGITKDYGARMSMHRIASSWFPDVRKIEVLFCENKIAALALEDEIILAERPPFNKYTPDNYGVAGGNTSGAIRSAAVKAGCERIRERWGMPSDLWSTSALCEEANVSRPTAFQYLGRRSIAQRNYEIALALAERNRSRRKQA